MLVNLTWLNIVLFDMWGINCLSCILSFLVELNMVWLRCLECIHLIKYCWLISCFRFPVSIWLNEFQITKTPPTWLYLLFFFCWSWFGLFCLGNDIPTTVSSLGCSWLEVCFDDLVAWFSAFSFIQKNLLNVLTEA